MHCQVLLVPVVFLSARGVSSYKMQARYPPEYLYTIGTDYAAED